MKRFISIVLLCALVLNCCLVSTGFAAKSKKMEADVPVWTEETVTQYVLDYINGVDMERLWGYYDLQIRRYMPFVAYSNMLLKLEWMTGEFEGLGSYTVFEEEDTKLKTHVIHLCMEKQDLDLYFTHKNQEDDWEVMALQFVPAEEQTTTQQVSVGEEEASENEVNYTEINVTIGTEEYPLNGILTLPNGASAENKVPVCILVHDEGPLDMNSTIGNTALFKDIAHMFGNMGVATLRYDKRTYTYGETAEMTAYEETIQDAALAGKLAKEHECIDPERVVLVAHGFGAHVAPRIAFEDRDVFTAMILIGGSPINYAEQLLSRTDLTGMPQEEAENLNYLVGRIGNMNKNKAKEVELFGKNGYYFYELEQSDPINLIKRLKMDTYIVQGSDDPVISEMDGWRKYSSYFGDKITFMEFHSFQGLNHLLMVDGEVDEQGKPVYQKAVHLDKAAGRTLCQWVRKLNTNIQ
ncbi:MAG: hypothetical protein E7331_00330 [Clostridiales bacterium]|nr:hypothetical protein [Clostridiales bacterium]